MKSEKRPFDDGQNGVKNLTTFGKHFDKFKKNKKSKTRKAMTTISDKNQERINAIKAQVEQLAESTIPTGKGKAALARKAELEANVENWMNRLNYCTLRMDEEEFLPAFLTDIECYLAGKGNYVTLGDKVLANTLIQLLRELTPLIGLEEHRLFALTDGDVRETVLPGGTWVMRCTTSKVRRNKNSFSFYFSRPASMDEWEMKSKMMKAVELVKGE